MAPIETETPSPPAPLPKGRGEPISVRVPGFLPSTHGFPFANSFPAGTPVFRIPTPFGRIPVGDASLGLCGGMVFTAMDLHHHGRAVPETSDHPGLLDHIARRLIASWNLPLGGIKYYDWQRRSLAWLTKRTITVEWPKIKAELDAGRLAPLGIVFVEGWNLRKIGRNHQVLAYGYDLDESTGVVSICIYDPNYPSDDDCKLELNTLNPNTGCMIVHTCEGPTVRGFFLTKYRKLKRWPAFT